MHLEGKSCSSLSQQALEFARGKTFFFFPPPPTTFFFVCFAVWKNQPVDEVAYNENVNEFHIVLLFLQLMLLILVFLSHSALQV